MTQNPAPAAVAAIPARRRVPNPSRARLAPSAGQVQRRARAVWLVKLALPAIAVSLLAVLFLWPEIEGREGRLSFRRGPAVTGESLQVVSPRFQGVDELNRPFTVTARLGRQVGQEEVMLLEAPRADILLNDGAWVFVESRDGRYDKPAHVLELNGDVRIFHDGGTLFVTEAATVLLNEGSAHGERPTQAQGSFGTIDSEGFRMTERGAVMVFTGRARAVLEGRQQ
ncbi:LPS export ABC transporter periplasmic protein LptC [Roseococcus sp. DSY-14]|uniref:LPS export ABC transporter periplasmic protein LptC n=1 Tax=Roseococcus sp. DSY-14 TaxID=3369650 RepID=UPI00387B572F